MFLCTNSFVRRPGVAAEILLQLRSILLRWGCNSEPATAASLTANWTNSLKPKQWNAIRPSVTAMATHISYSRNILLYTSTCSLNIGHPLPLYTSILDGRLRREYGGGFLPHWQFAPQRAVRSYLGTLLHPLHDHHVWSKWNERYKYFHSSIL